jgi:hypothetical protein
VEVIPAGAHLIWDPVHLPPQSSSSAEVSAALLPVPKGDLILMQPRKAAQRQEWVIPKSPGVIALVYGPQGLSAGKVKKLVGRDDDLLSELANYAEQTSEVEALVQELADSEASGAQTDAVLKGFSSRYGVAMPKLNPSATTNEQAGVLLSALMPTANSFDPLASPTAQTQQSAGLAASVAGMFFGANVGLAAGGVALFADLKTMMFPGSDFRSAFAQASAGDGLTLCTKSAAPKPRTHIVYLWAYRVPNQKPPALSLAGDYVPAGSKSPLKVTGPAAGVKDLLRAREWRLVPVAAGTPSAVPVTVAADSLEVDLSKVKVPPGDYHLQATCDWAPLDFGGLLHVRPYGDFSHVEVAPESRDSLVAGSGTVPVELTGADFEFVEKAALEQPAGLKKTAPPPVPRDLTFTLAAGKRAGEQRSMEVNVDTTTPGAYRLALTQADGVKHEVPLTILPPNPKISNLPIRVNQGEGEQPFRLEGSGLERIEAVATDAGTVAGAGGARGWLGTIRLKPGLAAGARFPLTLKVLGLVSPLTVKDAVEVVGPRPKILSVRNSMPGNLGIAVHDGELPAGTIVGLALRVEHLYGDGHANRQPVVSIGCAGGDSRPALKLLPNQQAGGASLTLAGPGLLYLSLDPGKVGYPGCDLTATVTTEPEGGSDGQPLGRVIRIPRVEQLTLTNEKSGSSNYIGVLKGSDLDIIEKVGWCAETGVPVDSIPTPVPGEPAEQTLRVALPWPAPQPHAPLYVWLRDERQGRETTVTF